jgi:hypothetical protein
MFISERREIFIAERSRARKSQLSPPGLLHHGCERIIESRSLPALATQGLTPNTCAAEARTEVRGF